MKILRALTAVLHVLTAVLLALVVRTPHARASPEQEAVPALEGQSERPTTSAAPLAFRARLELGALGVLAHHIKYGQGTRIDYRRDADQDTLFFFARLSAEVVIRERHGLVFLYQPLAFDTTSVVGRELRVGQVTFPANAPVRFNYGFDFYRLAYQFDVLPGKRRELAFGAGFQIRNARVSFVSVDGSRAYSESNLGVVPLLRMRARYVFDNALFIESELDGWVSPVPGQGRDGELALGAIADGSLRAGAMLRPSCELFLTLRYLGGGYRGKSDNDNSLAEPTRWNSNWLHTLTLSVGVGLR